MYVADLVSRISVASTTLTPSQKQALFESPNAMSVFMYPQSSLPEGNYLIVQDLKSREFLGAVLVEHEPAGVNLHMMFLKRDRERFTIATELAVLYIINCQQKPITKVLTSPQYDYMHKFLSSLGFFKLRFSDEQAMYYLPNGWKPRNVKSYCVGHEV